jgi:adenine-specific DNA-methyltransferase
MTKTKEELLEENEKLKNKIEELKNRKEYGLVWEERHEEGVKELKHNLPVFNEVESMSVDGKNSRPDHLLIEGDNYHALKALNYTHKSDVDAIYIDPPYNRGKEDFIFNDDYVDEEDKYRHSKWLSFMSQRLRLSRDLLSQDGVIFISIGRDEFSQLKILCDEIFGEKNFIANFIWEKTQHFGRQKSNYYSNADYILSYAKQLHGDGKKELLVEKVKTDHEDAPLYNASNPEKSIRIPEGEVVFNIDDGKYTESTNDKYELLSPVRVRDGKNDNELKIRFKSRWSQSKVDEQLEKGAKFWVKTNSFSIRVIYPESKKSHESLKQIIFTNNNNELVAKDHLGQKVGVNEDGTKELNKMMGEQNIFQYPKPKSLIRYLLASIFDYKKGKHKKDITVLDFFAGSGTTAHAVMDLNSEDGGCRKSISVTNNEGGIAREVCQPRIKKAIEGYSYDSRGNTHEVEGLGGSLKYYKTNFVGNKNSTTPTDSEKIDLSHNAGEMIAIREDTLVKEDETDWWQIFSGEEQLTAVYFRENKSQLNNLVRKLGSQDKPVSLYVFSWSTNAYNGEFSEYDNIEVDDIPQPILEVYREINQL